jgi:phage-related protein
MSLTLDGKRPEELGLKLLQEHQHPALPETRDRSVEIPGKHGAYDFGADLGVRNFELPFLVNKFEKMDLQYMIRNFAALLVDPYGKPRTFKLIFAYEPDKFYMVRYSGSVPVDRLVRMGNFVLPLTAFDPFAYFIVPSDEITMGSDIPIMSDILWGTGLSGFTITAPQTISIINNGNQVIRLSYLLEGSGTNVTMAANGKSFSLGTFTNTNWEIDGDGYVTKKNGVIDLTSTSGDFVELLPGTNEVTFSGSNLNLELSERMIYKYI